MPISSPKSRPQWGRLVLCALWIFLGLLVVAIVGGRVWLRSYLHGPGFQRFVSDRLSRTLRAEVTCSPFRADGLTLYCDEITARGYEDSPFASAKAVRVWARFELGSIFQEAWKIQRIDSEGLEVRLGGPRLPRPTLAPATPVATTKRNWVLPNRIEVVAADLRDVELSWGEGEMPSGALRRLDLQMSSTDMKYAGWKVTATAGELWSAGLPPLNLTSASMRYRRSEQSLEIDEASFTEKGGGSAKAHGEVDFGRAIDIKARITSMPITPLLTGDWRLRLHGNLTGDVRVESPLPAVSAPTISGALQLEDGRMEALPILNQIATFTQNQQLRQLPLSVAMAEFRQKEGRFEISKLTAESPGRLRLEGGFKISDGLIDGTIDVGLPPTLLEWIPGANEQVFTTARKGYRWAPMHLSGPANALAEDLSGKLAVAAGNKVIEKVEDTATQAIQGGREVIKKSLDLLMPLVR